MAITILYGIILTIAHYLGKEIHYHKYKWKIISFGAGVLLVYLILDLFPRLYIDVFFYNKLVFLAVLFGFVLFYLFEKHVYQHASKEKMLRQLKEIHTAGFFIYSFIIGIVLANVSEENLVAGALFAVPLVFRTLLGGISLQELHYTIKANVPLKVFLSLSTLFGVLLALYFEIPFVLQHILLAFVLGVLLFMVIREVLPKNRRVDTFSFITGVLFYAIVIISSWILEV